MVVQKNKAAPVNIAELRPYLVHPTEIAWKVLPVFLKKQVGTIERLDLYKSMFGPRPGEDPAADQGEPPVDEPSEPPVEPGDVDQEPPVVEPPVDQYIPSQPEKPEVVFTEPGVEPTEDQDQESTNEGS